MLLRERHVTVGRSRLRVRTLRHGEGRRRPVLVFLHEGLGCIEMWGSFPERLAHRCGLDAVIYDRAGHGRSTPLLAPREKDYLEREAFSVLPAILKAVGQRESILVGHSDGGTIALLHAARHPVRALVVEAAHVFVEEQTLAGIRRAVQDFEEGRLREKLARYHGKLTTALFGAWADTWLSARFRDWNVTGFLPHNTAPLLVIQGQDDEYGTVAQAEAIAWGSGGMTRQTMIPRCGHSPHLQAREQVLETTCRFFRDIADTGGGAAKEC